MPSLRVGLVSQLSDWAHSPFPGHAIDVPGQMVNVNFLVAALAFNERRADLVPALGAQAMMECAVNISVPRVCDDSGNSLHSIAALNRTRGMFDAVVGVDSSTDLFTTAQAADSVFDLPIVNHWASSPLLTDKSIFTKVARTGQNDAAMAQPLATLIANLGYRRAILLFVSGAAGPAFASVLAAECFAQGVELLGVSYDPDSANGISLEAAIKQIVATSFNVIVVYAYSLDYITGTLPSLAAKYGLNRNTLWMWTNFDRFPTTDEFAANPELRAIFDGALGIDRNIPTQYAGLFQSYVQQWNTAIPSRYLAQLNAMFPPYGNIQHDCLHESTNYSVSQAMFNATKASAFPTWAHAFDAVMSLGFAACHISAANISLNGSTLYQALMQVDFLSLSGRVRFNPATGDRTDDAAVNVLYNWRDNMGGDGTLEQLAVGQFNLPSSTALPNGAWIYSPLVFAGGSSVPPLELRVSPQDYQYISSGLIGFAYAVVVIVNALCLTCSVLLVLWRRRRSIIQSQPLFMQGILLGVALASWSVLGLTVDDNPSRSQLMSPNSACNFFYCVYLSSFVFSLAMLSGKLYRVYSVFSTDRGLKVGARLEAILLCVGLVMALQFLLVGLFQGLAPLQWTRTPTSVNALGVPLTSYGACVPASSAAAGFLSALIAFYVLMLLACVALGSSVDRIPEQFREISYVTLAVFIIMQLILIGIPVVIALSTSGSVPGLFLCLALIVFFSSVVLVVILFAPKLRSSVSVDVGATKPESGADVSVGALNVRVEDGLCVSRVKSRFLVYAERRMVLENALFICDVQLWRSEYDEKAVEVRAREAVAMGHIYIHEGALLQVNLSSQHRTEVEAKLREPDVAKDAFDAAYREICSLLNANAWTGFVEQGGLYGIAELSDSTPNRPNSPKSSGGNSVNNTRDLPSIRADRTPRSSSLAARKSGSPMWNMARLLKTSNDEGGNGHPAAAAAAAAAADVFDPTPGSVSLVDGNKGTVAQV